LKKKKVVPKNETGDLDINILAIRQRGGGEAFVQFNSIRMVFWNGDLYKIEVIQIDRGWTWLYIGKS